VKRVILPGAIIGVLGSGQLGRMFTLAARRMGYRVHTFSPDSDTPTGQVADVEINAPYEDLDAVTRFAEGVDVVTFEFENVPAVTAQAAAARVPVRPRGEVLHITQNRLREKKFLSARGFPVTRFAAVCSVPELRRALETFGSGALLKTAGFGYDGKGQVRLTQGADCSAAWTTLQSEEAVLEALVDYEMELSIVAARGVHGEFAHYGAIRNDHVAGILDVSSAPAGVPENIEREAIAITAAVLEALDVTGVLCVEFFVTRDGRLLINELAPRPHNSGHLTIDSCLTSQFEQQLRAVCGLPLGSTERYRAAAMANLLGDLWNGREPNWAAVCALPEIKLHLYGKLAARPGRKMGHLTATAPTAAEAGLRVRAARQALKT
jgi:5-(carboxyamino)imidazole ribonucleotide synthase